MEPTERREDVEVLAHVHLRKEHINLEHALQAISDWVRSGAGEGANFLVTRLTGPIAGGSLFGGADISQFTPAGARGSLHSQGGIAYHLDFSSGSHVNFPLEAHVGLNSGEVTLTWMPPDQAAHSSTFRLAYVQKRLRTVVKRGRPWPESSDRRLCRALAQALGRTRRR